MRGIVASAVVIVLALPPLAIAADEGVCDSTWCVPCKAYRPCSHRHGGDSDGASGPTAEELQRAYDEEQRRLREQEASEHNDAGILARNEKRWPAAIASFEKAVELSPDHGGYRKNLADARDSALREIRARETLKGDLGKLASELDADPCAGAYADTKVVDVRPDCTNVAGLAFGDTVTVDLRGSTKVADPLALKGAAPVELVLPMPPDADALFATPYGSLGLPAADLSPYAIDQVSLAYYLAQARAVRAGNLATDSDVRRAHDAYLKALQHAMRVELLDSMEKDRARKDLELARLSEAVESAFTAYQEKLLRAFVTVREASAADMREAVDVLSRKLRKGETLADRERSDPAFRKSLAEALAAVFRKEQDRLAAAERKAQQELRTEVTRIMKGP